MLKLLFFVLLGLILVCVIIIAILDVEIKKDDEKIKDIQAYQEYFWTKNSALDQEFAALSDFVHMWTDPGVPSESYYAHLPQIKEAITRMQEINKEQDVIVEEMRAYIER